MSACPQCGERLGRGTCPLCEVVRESEAPWAFALFFIIGIPAGLLGMYGASMFLRSIGKDDHFSRPWGGVGLLSFLVFSAIFALTFWFWRRRGRK